MALNPRSEYLLKTLIDRYIAEGTPVGSRTLAKHAEINVSPATIRNIMADLEELGLIKSPHTSAGRVPTQAGYRLFVDSLVKVRPLESSAEEALRVELERDSDPGELAARASGMISRITHLAGVVMVPRLEEENRFRQIEFLSLSEKRVLVILVTGSGQVLNSVIEVDHVYSPSELVQSSNYFNETYGGSTLQEVKNALLREIQADSETMQKGIRLAAKVAEQMFSDDREKGVVVSGEANLMDVPEMEDVRKLRKIFDIFSTKRDLLDLLDRSMKAGGVNIFIGNESGYEGLDDCSVVTAPYSVDDQIVGTIGVVGPTRMAYDRVIPVVDITARLISKVLATKEG
ncbi:MAG: heat-inducible transcriptional repressor HrcA [Acidiferrobacterales bacterium]